MNHSGDANKMVSDTPRTDAEYERLHKIYQNAERINGPLCCAFENDMRLCRQLERELNAATSEIERLRKANLQLREGAEEQKQRIQRLEEAAQRVDDAAHSIQDWSGTVLGDALDELNKAKEAKP